MSEQRESKLNKACEEAKLGATSYILMRHGENMFWCTITYIHEKDEENYIKVMESYNTAKEIKEPLSEVK